MQKYLNKVSKRTIVITGGKGLLGSSFYNKYKKQYIIIRYPHRIEYFSKFKKWLKNKNFNYFIHFAALKSVGESVEKPELYHSNNVGGTKALIDVMKKFGVEKLVFSSSCTVYGQPEVMPVDENAPLLPPESPYGETKQKCEELISNSGIKCC